MTITRRALLAAAGAAAASGLVSRAAGAQIIPVLAEPALRVARAPVFLKTFLAHF